MEVIVEVQVVEVAVNVEKGERAGGVNLSFASLTNS